MVAKERNKNQWSFLPVHLNNGGFNPPLRYCPGREWAYEARLQDENLSAGDGSYSSGSWEDAFSSLLNSLLLDTRPWNCCSECFIWHRWCIRYLQHRCEITCVFLQSRENKSFPENGCGVGVCLDVWRYIIQMDGPDRSSARVCVAVGMSKMHFAHTE